MTTKQGSLSLLNDPVAQQLLNSPIPGHLAYTWKDGTPRLVPLGFTWTGTELVTGTFDNFPKVLALKDRENVAVTFDSYTYPFKVLYIRGTAQLSPHDGLVPEWVQAGERMCGKEGGQAFANMVYGMIKAGACTMLRLSVKPTWVGILDFERRFPSSIEKGMEVLAALQPA